MRPLIRLAHIEKNGIVRRVFDDLNIAERLTVTRADLPMSS